MGRIILVALSILSMCAFFQASAQPLPREPLSRQERRAEKPHSWCEWNSQKFPPGYVKAYEVDEVSGFFKKKHSKTGYCQTCQRNGEWKSKVRCDQPIP